MKKMIATFVLSITCLLLGAFPAMAGEWKETQDEQWQYIQDDGSLTIGWLELDGERYYFDSKGIRKSDYWLKDDGAWYYFEEDGTMAKNTWVDNYYVDETGRFEKKR